MNEDEVLEIINSGQRSNQPDILEMIIIIISICFAYLCACGVYLCNVLIFPNFRMNFFTLVKISQRDPLHFIFLA